MDDEEQVPDVVMIGDGDSAYGGGGVPAAAGKNQEKVQGPCCREEDAVLSALVRKFGTRNWCLIAQRIAGQLRW